jgi:DNA-binding response OmpR family regulator
MNSQPKVRIALVEDYRTHREELEDLLRAEGFDAHGVESGEALTALLQRKGSFDLVVLDLNLPGEDGLSIARRLQSTSPATRIIMLSGRVKGSDKIQGYEAGADVYLTKPQRPKELLAVIWALTRRMVSVVGPEKPTYPL